MKKSQIISIVSIIAILFSQTAFAGFLDVKNSHPNSDAILYLQENGIIEGYKDGTFKPENTVNRAEFLKIILEGSNIPLNISAETPFSDINHEAWYAPYFRKAYAEKWVVGYTDGTAKPDQTISKAEALKILGEVRDWELESRVTQQPFEDTYKTAWFTPYISYAKSHEFLEETGKLFEPNREMTRANISEVIYRTMVGLRADLAEPALEAPEDATEPEDEAETEEPAESLTFTPVTYSTIDKDFFDEISLTENLPNTFYKNEIYIISGETTSGEYASVVIENAKTKKITSFSDNIENQKFEIPIFFSASGNYNIGIFAGTSGTSKAAEISVLPSLPDPTEEETLFTPPEQLNIEYENDQTSVEFQAPIETLTELKFTQNSKTVKYYNRQNIETLPIQYKDFENFKENDVTLTVSSAKIETQAPLKISSEFLTGESLKFTAIEHTYDIMEEDLISASPPDTLSSSSKSITFSGTVKTDTNIKAYIIKPDGFVDEFEISTDDPTGTYFNNIIIPKNSTFSFKYKPTEKGRYILEINASNATAIINHPVYVGGAIPLIPDFFDLNEREFFTGTFDKNDLAQDLLKKINNSRKEHGLDDVALSTELGDLAQAHSDDMVTNHYFGHINPKGQDPDGRRIEAGISTAVSENLAKDISIKFIHEGLMRSAAHRNNILNENWTKVGIGITLDNGYLIVTEEFSLKEPSAKDLADYKNALFETINNLRSENNKNTLDYDAQLEAASKDMNDKVIIDGVELTGELFLDILKKNGISGNSQAVGRIFNIWATILESILEDERDILLESTWKALGINIQIDDAGYINTIVILNK